MILFYFQSSEKKEINVFKCQLIVAKRQGNTSSWLTCDSVLSPCPAPVPFLLPSSPSSPLLVIILSLSTRLQPVPFVPLQL